MMQKGLMLLCALWMGLLASCGGGSLSVAENGTGGVGSGGTGITGGSVGYIAGFGSIYVNGIHYDIDSAAVQTTDDSSLKLGMSVKVLGTVSSDGSTGVASSVESQADAQGPVSNLNATTGSFGLHGLAVSTDSETVFDGITGLASLANGDWVKVYGQAWGTGQLRASRIEKLTTAATPILSGTVSSLDTVQQTFAIAGQTVAYSGASFAGTLSAASLQNGMVVRVRSNTAPSGGVIAASSIALWYPLPTTEAAPLSVAGTITNYQSMGSFQVLGYAIDASAALLTGGPTSAVGNGVKVEAVGVLRNGVLVASKLALRQIPGTPGIARFIATGPVANYVSLANFKVQGQAVDASGTVTFNGGTAAQLANRAVRVTVEGAQVLNGVLVANTVTFLP